MYPIFKKVLRHFISSRFYIASIALFLVLLNFFLWMQPETSILDFGFADLSALFYYVPLVFIFFIPSSLMSFAVDDFNGGASDFIFSKPVSPTSYFFGYYLAAGFIVLFFLFLTLSSLYSIYTLVLADSFIDFKQIFASYFGLLLAGLVFITLSCFAAVHSRNQAGAFLFGVLLCYCFFSLPSLISELPFFDGGVAYNIQYFSLDKHLEVLGRGILEFRTLFYFVSIILLFSFLSIQRLKSRLS